MKGLCDFTLAYGEYPRLRQFMQHACQTEGGTLQTFLLSRYLLDHHVPGAFVECGVAAGAQLACMALAMTRANDRRVIHAFDSFQGIPHAGPKDEDQPGKAAFLMERSAPLGQRLTSSGVTVCSLDGAMTLWKSWNFSEITVEWHEGWFQHTVPGNSVGPVAFLRLDGDLYESTDCCLRGFYDKVSPGGIVYVDDYGYAGCQKAVTEFLTERALAPEFMQDAQGNAGAIYWIK